MENYYLNAQIIALISLSASVLIISISILIDTISDFRKNGDDFRMMALRPGSILKKPPEIIEQARKRAKEKRDIMEKLQHTLSS